MTQLSKLSRAIALGFSTAALSLGLASPSVAASNPIKIGFVTFLSGPAAGVFGIAARDAAELMETELNKGALPAPYSTKGFGGTPIKFDIVDEAGGTTAQVTQFRNLVNQQHVDLVIGYISSGDCLAIAPVAEEMKKLTVLFDCGTPRIFEDASYKYVFRTGATATMDAVAAAMYLKDQKVKVNSYAGINQNYAWGQDSWSDFTGAMTQLFPKAKMVASQMTPFQSGQYGAPISTLLASNADVIQSSYWGGDLSGLILQGAPRGLFKKSLVVLTVGDPAMHELGAQIPDGTVIGARGPFSMYAPKSELAAWFQKAYEARFKESPNYEPYKVAQAILGVKTAYEKAQAANGGKAPDQDQVIAAFEHLTWTGPGGEVSLSRGKGHQAAQGTAYGRIKHVNGKTEFVDVEHFTAEQVTPPEGVKSEDWIKSGFKH